MWDLVGNPEDRFSHNEAQIRQVDFPILINWMSPLIFGGHQEYIFIFISFFDEIHSSIQNSPRWDAVFCSVTLRLFCLPMSHKKDARLIWVKNYTMLRLV